MRIFTLNKVPYIVSQRTIILKNIYIYIVQAGHFSSGRTPDTEIRLPGGEVLFFVSGKSRINIPNTTPTSHHAVVSTCDLMKKKYFWVK